MSVGLPTVQVRARRGPTRRWKDTPMAVADRAKALEAALAQIEKQHGKGSVMRLGDRVGTPMDVVPTGSIALDIALGIGGIPRGRVVEIYGPESSGKTTCLLYTSDAADDLLCVDLGGRRIIKKKKKKKQI